MGGEFRGDDARIWDLHSQGFCVSRICELVGLSDAYVRGVICGEWHDDKLASKRPRKG